MHICWPLVFEFEAFGLSVTSPTARASMRMCQVKLTRCGSLKTRRDRLLPSHHSVDEALGKSSHTAGFSLSSSFDRQEVNAGGFCVSVGLLAVRTSTGSSAILSLFLQETLKPLSSAAVMGQLARSTTPSLWVAKEVRRR